jgi:hypothetical protein
VSRIFGLLVEQIRQSNDCFKSERLLFQFGQKLYRYGFPSTCCFEDKEIENVLIVSSPQASSDSARVTDLSAFGGRAPMGQRDYPLSI